MEKQSKYLIILLIAFVVCIGVFWFQFNNDVSTVIILNETEVSEGGSFSGLLMDSYSYGVSNKTVTYKDPSNTLQNTSTDENGEFIINNVKKGSYSEFTFDGDDKYLNCIYEGNVSVI